MTNTQPSIKLSYIIAVVLVAVFSSLSLQMGQTVRQTRHTVGKRVTHEWTTAVEYLVTVKNPTDSDRQVIFLTAVNGVVDNNRVVADIVLEVHKAIYILNALLYDRI